MPARSLVFLFPYLVPLAGGMCLLQGGSWAFGVIAWIVAALPILDLLAGCDIASSPREHRPSELRAMVCRLALWLWPPVQVGFILWGLSLASRESATALDCVAAIWSLGLTGGMIGITVAHELMHGGRGERLLAELLMTLTSYPHFCIEHVAGHHRRVATAEDPATARLGESLFAFLPRSVWGSLMGARRWEARRLRQRGWRVWGLHNRMLRYLLALGLLYAAIGAGFGIRGVVVFAGQSVVGVFLLETINYIQHYGLLRREAAPGRFEPVRPWHSWNSSHRASNAFLFNLGRHPDHHGQAARPYQELRHDPSAPQLPAGYPTLFWLALCSPLWQALMDPRVRAWRHAHGLPNESLNPLLSIDSIPLPRSLMQDQRPSNNRWLRIDIEEVCRARTEGLLPEDEFRDVLEQREALLRARARSGRSTLRWIVGVPLLLAGLGVLLACGGCGATMVMGPLLQSMAPKPAQRGAAPAFAPPRLAPPPAGLALKADAVEAPLLFREGRPCVMAVVNGQGPFLLGLDTGSIQTARVEIRLVEKLGLTAKFKQAGLGGQVVLESIGLGDAAIHWIGVQMETADQGPATPRIDGVLGLRNFAGCRTTLDYPGRRLLLEKALLDGAPAPAGQNPALPGAHLEAAGAKVWVAIQSNSSDGFRLPRSVLEKLPLAEAPHPAGKRKIDGQEVEVQQARLKGEVRFGGRMFRDPVVIVSDHLQTASVGGKVLAHFIVAFDARNGRTRLEWKGDGKE